MRRGEKRVHDKDISRRKKLIAIGNRCQENSSAAHMVLFDILWAHSVFAHKF
jgi:hypothetical protein